MSARGDWKLYYWTGISWSELDLGDGTYDFGPIRHAYSDDMSVTVTHNVAFDTASPWTEGTRIKIEESGTLRFEGIVETVHPVRDNQTDEIQYTCKGLFAEANDVTFLKSGSARVAYNVKDPTDPDYDATREDKTVGDILEDVLDTMSADLPWTYYTDDKASLTDNDLSDLATVPGKMVFNGESVPSIIFRILSEYLPYYKTYFDEVAGDWSLVFIDTRTELDTITLTRSDMNENNLSDAFNWNRTGVYSAVEIQGDWELIEDADIRDPSGSTDITALWNTDYQASWTEELAAQNPDTWGQVFREYQLPNAPVLESRLSADCNWFLVFERVAGGYYSLPVEIMDVATGKFRTKYAMQDGGTERKFWLRYAYRSGRITGREPNAGYSGSAYSVTGIERVEYIIDEDYKKMTINGETSHQGINSIIDRRLGATPGKLLQGGAELVLDGSNYGAITANGYYTIEATDLSGTYASGLDYSIILQDDSTVIDDLATALHGEVSERNFSGSIVIDAAAMGTYKLGNQVNLSGWSNSDWSSLRAVIQSVTTDPWTEQTTLELASLSSIGANRSYQQLKESLWLHAQTEENEIQIGRLARASNAMSNDAGGIADEGDATDTQDHRHNASGDGGWLHRTITKIEDDLTGSAALLDIHYVPSPVNKMQAGFDPS
jgi:hypothetical protein